MKDIDNDRLELLERQLAERVTKRVRSSLFQLYAIAGVAVIGALSFAGWDIVSDTKSEIKAEFKNELEKEIKAERNKVTEQVLENRIIAKRANNQMHELEEQLSVYKTDASDLKEILRRVRKIEIYFRDLIVFYDKVPTLSWAVSSLSDNLVALAKEVEQLNSIAISDGANSEGMPSQTLKQRSAIIQSVILDAREVEQRLRNADNKTNVLFQFAGGFPEQVEELSAALEDEDYFVFTDGRNSKATGIHEVRYFHEEDEEAAKHFADNTTSVMRRLAYLKTPNIRVRSLEAFPGEKPRPGLIELFLEIPPR